MQQRHIHNNDFTEGETTMISKRPDKYMRADHIPGPGQGNWTYSHYAELPEDGIRYEIVNGVLYMSPAPNTFHQAIRRWLTYYLTHYVTIPGLGENLDSPCDVELRPKMVFQPDAFVVLKENTSRLLAKRIFGAPDIVVEIASPSTLREDRGMKRFEYARAGVKEYWLVNPIKETFEVLVLEDGAYQSLGVFAGEDLLPTRVIPHFPVQVKQFFVWMGEK